MTDKIRIIYQDRISRITKFIVKGSHRYKIEITDGRFFRSWQKYYVNDEEAIKSANREFGSLFDSKGDNII